MADITRNTETLKLECVFVDGDTRTITLKNPIADNESLRTQFATINSYIQRNNLLIGDKYGGTFGKINQVKRIVTARTQLDLTDA